MTARQLYGSKYGRWHILKTHKSGYRKLLIQGVLPNSGRQAACPQFRKTAGLPLQGMKESVCCIYNISFQPWHQMALFDREQKPLYGSLPSHQTPLKNIAILPSKFVCVIVWITSWMKLNVLFVCFIFSLQSHRKAQTNFWITSWQTFTFTDESPGSPLPVRRQHLSSKEIFTPPEVTVTQ